MRTLSEAIKLYYQNKLNNKSNNEIREKYRQYKSNRILVERNMEIYGVI